jgi:hypothetical protein
VSTELLVEILDDQVADDADNTFKVLLVPHYFFSFLLDEFVDVFGDLVREQHLAGTFDGDLADLLVRGVKKLLED